MEEKFRPVVITGPTGVGKTELGIQIAKRLNGEIISVDSRQIYRLMDIGTAKPTPQQREQVVHHLINICNPNEIYTAGRFSRDVRLLISGLQKQKIRPILVGGSGMYFSAIIDGLFSSGLPNDDVRTELSDRLEKEGLSSLYSELETVDPISHARLSPNDMPRILRALEVAIGTPVNRTTHFRAQANPALKQMPLMFVVSRNRNMLYQRIDSRVDTMISQGWVQEIEQLFELGYPSNCVGLRSLGYDQLIRHIEEGSDIDSEISEIKQRTRRYAKRQITWLKKDRRLRWLDIDHLSIHGVAERIIAQVIAQ